MARLQLVAIIAPLLVCSVVAPTHAQESERQGLYSSLETTLQERVLVLKGGDRFGVPREVYARLQEVFEGLRPGDAIMFTLDPSGRVSGVRRQAADTGASNRRRNVSARFDRLVTTQDGRRRWLVLGDHTQLLISDEVYQRHSRVLQFLRSGDALRLTVEGGWVIDVATGASARQLDLDPQVEEAISASKAGDVVTVNGEVYRFLGQNLIEIRVQPRIPNTDPPTFVDGAERKIALELIKSYDNPRLARESATTGGDGDDPTTPRTIQDAFKDVRLGDTVGIDFDIGQLLALTDTHFTWRIWRNDEWSAPEPPRERAGVSSVRPVSLASQQVIPVEGGELHLKVNRRRAGRESGLVLDVEASHALAGTIVVGAKLRFHLGDMTMTRASAPLATEELSLPSLFEGQVVKARHATQVEGAFDGRVELVVEAENRVSISSPQARGYLLAAIEQAATGTDFDAQARVYVAAGKNGDRDVARVLVSRALGERDPARRAAILAGLEAFGAMTPTVILEDLFMPDRNLQVAILDRGEVRKVQQLPGDERQLSYKRRLISLLAEVPGAIQPPFGGRLFDLYLSREELSEAVDSAFTKRPAEAVASLLDVATSTTSVSTPDEVKRAETAAGLLQKLGPAVLDEILRELRRREVAVDAIQKAFEQGGNARASEVVSMALGALLEDDVRRRRLALDQQVEQARALIDQKKHAEAAELLRAVLQKDKGHGPTLEVLPPVLLQLAADALAAGDRVRAGVYYTEVLALLPPGEQPRTKTALGELLLEAIGEELEENVVRAAPDDLAPKVRAAARDEQLTGPEVLGGWVEIPASAEAMGYIRVKCLVPLGNDTWTVREPSTPFECMDGLLERVAALAPTLSVRCSELRGRVYARDAAALYEDGQYAAALPLFAKGSELAPTDERLSLELSCKVKAYSMQFLGLAALILLLGGIAAWQTFAKPRRVRWAGEYKHYGSQRAQRERDLEVEEGAAADPNAPPPETPPTEAPPS